VDENFHVDFIWSAANLRGMNYRLPPANRLDAKVIAGNILPAVAQTTATVTGLVMCEALKLLQGDKGEASGATWRACLQWAGLWQAMRA
jgi:ubiquitin-activating enzyme E1